MSASLTAAERTVYFETIIDELKGFDSFMNVNDNVRSVYRYNFNN